MIVRIFIGQAQFTACSFDGLILVFKLTQSMYHSDAGKLQDTHQNTLD